VRADVTYERGLMALASPWKDADLVAMMVNGQGLSAGTEARNYDTGSGKNFGFRLSQGLGKVRVGGFLYTGEEEADGLRSGLRILGPDATLALNDKFEVNFQYLYRQDGNPFFLATCTNGDPRCSYGADDPLETEVDSWMGEVLFFPKGSGAEWALTALYNRIEANSPIFSLRVGEEGLLQQYESVGFSVQWLKARNVRLMAEVSRDLELKRTRFVGGVTAAF